MSRKTFIEKQGATCRNWTWSWSFINEKERIIIFGAWDKFTEARRALILDEAWVRNDKGRKQPGYPEAREHVRLVAEEGYALKTFTMYHSNKKKDRSGKGPATIKGINEELTLRTLEKEGAKWYAKDDPLSFQLPEEVDQPEKYMEGTSRAISINAYERNAKARIECIKHYGAVCIVCGFDFQVVYGQIAAGYIHVHHLVPLSEIKKKYELDPIRDLRPVCPNCHAIIHSKRPALTVDQLKDHLGRKGTRRST